MIIVHKATEMIGRKTLSVYVYVELDGDNADQNGVLNIMRKVVGDSYVSGIVNSGHSL